MGVNLLLLHSQTAREQNISDIILTDFRPEYVFVKISGFIYV